MKRIIILLLFFLMGCQIAPPGSVPVDPSPSSNRIPVDSIPAYINAFQFNERCPHLCWMRINPGVTSVGDAEARLSTSTDIDGGSVRTAEDGATAVWFANPTHTQLWHVGILFDQGFVTSISFDSGTSPYQLGDFVRLLSEPDEISIRLIEEPDARYLDLYTVIYQKARTAMLISPGNRFGPTAEDTVKALLLNTAFSSADMPKWLVQAYETRQPWRGYGHFDEYLPGQIPPPLHNNPLGP